MLYRNSKWLRTGASPKFGYTQVLLGKMYLTSVDIVQARAWQLNVFLENFVFEFLTPNHENIALNCKIKVVIVQAS